jgi:F-type H+-transporting ATPase subunit b
METIVVIIKALKIDQTVFIQFALLLVFFNILAIFFFKRLQAVLDYREGKTTKLENHAHAVYKQAEDLAAQYKAKVEKTHKDSLAQAQKKKSDALNREHEILREAEEKLNQEYESNRAIILKDMSKKRESALAEADKLSGNLVEKLTK